MKIPLPRLPPPQTIAHWLKPVESLSLSTLLLIDLPPPWIGLLGYPSGIVDTLDIEHKTYRLAYYGKSIELSITRRLDLDRTLHTLKKTVSLLWRDGAFTQYRPTSANNQKVITMTKTAATKPAATTTIKNKTAGQKAFVPPPNYQDLPTDWAVKLLSPTAKHPISGVVMYCGFLLLNCDIVLKWLEHNIQNRKINWKQISTLLDNWRDDWVSTANLWAMDWRGIVADGQHRAISFVLAFGSLEQVRKLILLLSSITTTKFVLSDDKKNKVRSGSLDDVKASVPIANYQLSTKELPEFFVPCVVNGDPRIADKADTDQRKRTGADQLDRNEDAANLLAQYGLESESMQAVLRHIWLRVNPPTAKEEQGGARYGTLTKGGKPKEDDYPVFLGHVYDSFVKALDLITSIEGYFLSPLSREEILATLILAYEGGVPEKQINAWFAAWCKGWTKDKNGFDVEPSFDGLAGACKKLFEDEDDLRRKDRRNFVYAASYAIQQPSGNPADYKTFSQFDKALVEDKDGRLVSLEQNSLCRLPGPDTVGDPRFISASVRKKLQIERKKLGLASAEPPKKKGPKAKAKV